MTLADQVAARTHTPQGRLLIDNREVLGFSARIRFGFGQPVSLCELTLRERPAWLDFGMRVEVWLGYDGFLRQRFVGFVEEDSRQAWPHSRKVSCAGYMRFAERKNPSRVVYQNQSARAIIADLLTRAGVPFASIGGDDTTLGTIEDVALERAETYLSLIQQIDQPFLCKTFDWLPDGTVRRMTLTQLPAAAAKWVYSYPGNVLSIDNPLTVREVRNRVEVTGLDGVTAYRRADSPYVDPNFDAVHEVRSDLIETADVAADVALLWMPTVDRMTRNITIRTAGNPTLDPGDTILLDADSLGIDEELLYLAELDDDFGPGGYYSQLTLVGGRGEAGYAIYPPRATFTVKVTQERFDAGDGLATYYTVFCDGSGSSSPTGLALAYAWSNNRTADTGATAWYSFRLTAAEWAAGCDATLTVTDAEGETDEVTRDVESAAGGVQIRDLYLAKGTDAESTPNGGVTWYTSTIDATCTPLRAWASSSAFGAGAVLYWTDDHLQTAPTAIHTFGSNITAISARNPMDDDRLAVGLANGQVWRTTSLQQGASSTWTLYGSRGSAITWVYWGHDGVLWDLAGRYVRASGGVQAGLTLDSGYTATGLALVSSFADPYHYSAGTNGVTAVVRRGDGTDMTFEAGYAPVRLGGFPHPNEIDVYYAADEQGRFYRKAAGATEFSYVSTIGGGECYHLLNVGGLPLILYASCENGLYKSYDGGASWHLMRSGRTLQAGIGSEPWGRVAEATVVSDTDAVCLNLWNGTANDPEPADWRQASFDDSAWSPAVIRSIVLNVPSGSNPLWSVDANVPAHQPEACLFRQAFTLGAGLISSATLQVANDDYCDGLWINGVLLYQDPYASAGGTEASTTVRTYPIPTGVLKAGANILAAKERQIDSGISGPEYIGWKLTVA